MPAGARVKLLERIIEISIVAPGGSWPKWWGALDVCVAFILTILVLAVLAIAHGKREGLANGEGTQLINIGTYLA